MAPEVVPPASGSLWRSWRRAIRFLQPQAKTLASVAFLSVLTSGLLAFEPLITKRLFDEIAGPKQKLVLVGAIAGLGLMLALREVLAARLEAQSWKVRLGLNLGLTRAAADRLHTLPLAFHRQE